ncbi:hypothetical protein GCK72_004197 [Caenorhabditis remanei]|uniref:F-box domain-containing protein n=1 Tax=Caenorhabditis remanei TaxID=31234 RepID=A0A6A5H8V0_CAERE|nr:hypothetical protein GCK72_004197 [Caenorhabditis remanei]KAF1764250.1 hypothetical protein GCK72_004197 [Caenorhabditis remanei]
MFLSFPKLPSVVQLEVLKQLELQEIFLLSLCSEKMKRAVQCLNMKPTNLMYFFLENGVVVGARYGNDPNQIDHNVANVQFVPTIPSDEMKPMKLGGNTISCRCIETSPERKSSHALHYLASEEITVLQSLQRHMKDLFRFDTRVQLVLYSLHYMNMSRIIDDVTNTTFDVEELDTEQLENYLTIHPGQDSLVLATKLTGPLLRSDSILCSIKTLALHGLQDTDGLINLFLWVESRRNPRLQFSEVINNFGGKYLFLTDVVYDVTDLAQLIWKWKSKEAYHNLKFVSSTPPTGTAIGFEHAMQQFDFVEWDGQRRPRTFKLDPKIINLQLNSFEDIDCSEWMDIQQDGGGKWASIMLSQIEIGFVVWD